MKLGDITDIAVSGLVAQRARMAATASNVANAQTTRSESGGVYRRRDPVFRTEPVGGRLERALHRVEVERVVLDARAPLTRFEPGHPDADADGYVALPRVNVVEELSNMMSAARSYESNLIILRKVREMAEAARQIGR
jgi:flagellar basal-body rod protein FlgC